ncbi:HNH endonuclease signature motif containing protein [Longimicrobium sp.]|uniref:HNH endonuclease n=1 Tax=Longimicrobium sp. TaxID=2029185 RepID=UPI002E30A02B|nr:HNH endonuclease signature motif containing protein [Longimicrobium sp.]HEX6041235.1 HNH endonuclease signature motif containing protein [Longimicrobium sp.]
MATVSPTRFYTDVLGAELRNPRWSWGAHDPVTDRLYLRVWEDEIVEDGGASFVMVLRNAARPSNGRTERQRHLDLFVAGAEAYGVLCTPDGPRRTDRPRKIRGFDSNVLLRFGRLNELPKGLYAEILERVPLQRVMRTPSGATSLQADLRAILRVKGLTETERDALVSARIGQGAFRTAVLARWHGRCAVTGCGTLNAIRASHIKPWRLSTNAERLDPANGLPLVATLDALFDAGLIAFAGDGSMLVSGRLSAEEREKLQLHRRRLSQSPDALTAVYLSEHRVRYGFVS